VSRDG